VKKRFWALALACALCLGLTACTGQTAARPFDVDSTPQALLDSGAFTDPADMQPPLEAAVLFDRLAADAVTAGAAYASTYTAEVAAVVVFTDADGAKAGLAVLEQYVADQTDAERDYRPAEADKLEKAILEQRENTVLLVVANDPDAARKALDAWDK